MPPRQSFCVKHTCPVVRRHGERVSRVTSDAGCCGDRPYRGGENTSASCRIRGGRHAHDYASVTTHRGPATEDHIERRVRGHEPPDVEYRRPVPAQEVASTGERVTA